jgi:hypothetical protein
VKSHFLQLLFAFGAVGAMTIPAHAATYQLVADIPFPFHVGAQTFEPGKYVIDSPVRSEVQYLTSAATGKRLAAFMGDAEIGSNGHARLVFRDYGDSKFLGDIWAVSGEGTKLPLSKAERGERKRWQSNEVPVSPNGAD